LDNNVGGSASSSEIEDGALIRLVDAVMGGERGGCGGSGAMMRERTKIVHIIKDNTKST
jgi:hypothetical protein